MLSEKKIKLMIRLADYEQNQGRVDLERTKYYKLDYIRYEILKTLICVTGTVFLALMLIGTYHMEFLITNALELDYARIAKYFLVIYILLLCLFSFVTISISSVRYEASKNRVKDYYSTLQELITFYEEEEESSKEESAL